MSSMRQALKQCLNERFTKDRKYHITDVFFCLFFEEKWNSGNIAKKSPLSLVVLSSLDRNEQLFNNLSRGDGPSLTAF